MKLCINLEQKGREKPTPISLFSKVFLLTWHLPACFLSRWNCIADSVYCENINPVSLITLQKCWTQHRATQLLDKLEHTSQNWRDAIRCKTLTEKQTFSPHRKLTAQFIFSPRKQLTCFPFCILFISCEFKTAVVCSSLSEAHIVNRPRACFDLAH